MDVSYDASVDMAYITLTALPEGARRVVTSIAVDDNRLRADIVLDFNGEGHLVGLEIARARSQLPPEIF